MVQQRSIDGVHVSAVPYIGLLAILALLSTWLLAAVQSTLQQDAQVNDEAPLLYVDNLLATRMNLQGVREYTLTSPHLTQLPREQGIRIDKPQIDVFQNGRVPEWLVRAERGWISAKYDRIQLEGAVSLIRPASSDKQKVMITTRNVFINPDEGHVETTEAVRAKTPGGCLNAVGLKAYLHEQQVELLSRVRGHYAPPPKP